MNNDRLLFNRKLHIIFCITMIAVMEVSIISPVLPTIASSLNLTSKQANLMIVFFTMPGIFLSPFMGIAGDRFGRKKVLVPSLLIFGTCGSLCFFVNDFKLILMLRFLQGTGAASLGSLNQTVIGDVFPGKERIIAMGYNSTVLSMGTMLYPAIGGAVALIGWHYPFLVSLLAFPVAALVTFSLDNPEPAKNGKIGQYLKESLALLKTKQTVALYFTTFATFTMLYGIILAFYPYYIKGHFAASPFLTGIVLSSSSIGSMIGSFNMGRFSGMSSSKRMMIAAFIFYIVSLGIAFVTPAALLFVIPVMLYGFANGILIPNIQTQLSIIAPMEYRGAFMSLNSTMLRAGQTVGPLLSGIILAGAGENYVFITGAVFALFVIFVIARAVPDMGNLEVK
ncbi:MAG TPA: MFS transporter [Spirochaetota bacterium]|nr:MFS transporter [Spirochaetota bacterium]